MMLADRLRAMFRVDAGQARLRNRATTRLYQRIVDQARHPVFYREYGVPDTVDGRFELIAVHGYLVMRRLKSGPDDLAPLAQALFDLMFQDMDRSLREMGVGDLSVGRKVKGMARAFYGRIAAYDEGLSQGSVQLAAALRRNLYGTVSPTEQDIARTDCYMRSVIDTLAATPDTALADGQVDFPMPECRGGAT